MSEHSGRGRTVTAQNADKFGAGSGRSAFGQAAPRVGRILATNDANCPPVTHDFAASMSGAKYRSAA